MTDYFRSYSIPVFTKIIDADLKKRIIEEYYHSPRAYVEFLDEDSNVYNLASCYSFYTRSEVNDAIGTFSAGIAKASVWNPRGSAYEDLIQPDQRKRIRVYFGQNIGGTIIYSKIFTGIPYDSPEKYSYGGVEVIRLRGHSVGYLLDRIVGDSEEDEFTGTSEDLLEYWVGQASLEYALSYEDYISFSDDVITYDTALAGINAIKNALGPKVIYYVDPSGVFVFKDLEEANAVDIEFEYTGSNCFMIKRRNDGQSIITSSAITGETGDISATGAASSLMISKYGINEMNISSGLVQSQALADKLADDIIDHGARYENLIEADMALNPYLIPNSLIKLDEATWSNTSNALMKVEEVTHRYNAGTLQKTNVKGYIG